MDIHLAVKRENIFRSLEDKRGSSVWMCVRFLCGCVQGTWLRLRCGCSTMPSGIPLKYFPFPLDRPDLETHRQVKILDQSLTAGPEFISWKQDQYILKIDGKANKADLLPGIKTGTRREFMSITINTILIMYLPFP